jgi:hypothetical protein
VSIFLYRSFLDLQQTSFLADIRPSFARMREERGPVEAPPRSDCRFCRPNPRSRALALAEPLRNRIFIHCQASDRWNYWFIKHELAHHCQFELMFPMRLPSWLIALRNPLTPSWWWEGGADYWAGVFDSVKDQYVRDLAGEGFYSLKDLFDPDILNPYDYMAIYYQGSHFWRFLDAEYGDGTGRKLYDRTARGIQLASQRPLQAVTGRKRAEVEKSFYEHERTRWAPMMEGRTHPAAEDRVTDTREYYRRRSWGGRWSPDGSKLAWVGNADVVPELYVEGRGMLGWNRSLDGSQVTSPPSWSPDGRRIVLAEWRINRDRLLLVDEDGGTEAVDLDFDEVTDPAWGPDGNRIAFAALKDGTSDLYVYHLDTGRVERITSDPEGDFQPAWSRDGRLAWIKETEGHQVLHVQGRGAVTRSWALMEWPQWTPDGTSVVLAADVGGVWDAFQVDVATGKAKRLTRFKGGVTLPQLHPVDGTLIFTYYQGRGQDLYRVRPEPKDEPDFDQEERKDWYRQFRKTPVEGTPAEKTRKWGVDWLMLPVLSGSLLTPGAEALTGDLDAENRVGAMGYFGGTRAWDAVAVAANTRWRPTIGILGGAGRRDELAEFRGMAFADYPVLKTLVVGTGWMVREREQHFDDGPVDKAEVFDSGPTVSLLYANQRSYQFWDPAWGASFGGSASFFRKGFGGDRNLTEYFGFFEASRDIVQDWILWTRVQWERMRTDDGVLEDELLNLERAVRGSPDREGLQRGTVSLELRFPIWRDVLFKPLEIIGIGEWWVIKDFRGFAFAQAGYAGTAIDQATNDDYGIASAGAGLRMDFSFMLWPVVNGRFPLRLELWGAVVGEDNKDPRGEWGGWLSFTY